MLQLKSAVQRLASHYGYSVGSTRDIDAGFWPIWTKCKPFTMTSVERGFALYKAVECVVRAGIPGDFVECGVWRGGSCMLMAGTLLSMNDTSRRIYLYDTFSGMTEPGDDEVLTGTNVPARSFWDRNHGGNKKWLCVSAGEVTANLAGTGYPLRQFELVVGDVRNTLPNDHHRAIAILRLDTDFYDSTKHELIHLYPLVSRSGVVLIDDYGCWSGARRAADEYIASLECPVLMTRIDGTGRVLVKP